MFYIKIVGLLLIYQSINQFVLLRINYIHTSITTLRQQCTNLFQLGEISLISKSRYCTAYVRFELQMHFSQ